MNDREMFHNNATKELASVYYNLYTRCINTKDKTNTDSKKDSDCDKYFDEYENLVYSFLKELKGINGIKEKK